MLSGVVRFLWSDHVGLKRVVISLALSNRFPFSVTSYDFRKRSTPLHMN
ncbi:MAG: hypothetical protein JWR17_1975 [Pseudomonas sp.]|nr:hypothetical protein [Pseudomonas sp.]